MAISPLFLLCYSSCNKHGFNIKSSSLLSKVTTVHLNKR
uniref:Uncharacterized protein n=1 Tax=Anguilla anguilla TaxID=7936 RepID=A0A0E9WK83_ANGAN